METEVKIRKVHLDYAGADGMPKPMTWALAADGPPDHHATARAAFARLFPEWTLRACQAAERDESLPATLLQGVPGEPGIWILRKAAA